MTIDTSPPVADPRVLGRDCDGCTLCCKVMGIAALDKPRGRWCTHCMPGQGCRIYETRPEECRTFYCAFLTIPDLGDHWRPAVSKMVVTSEFGGNRLTVRVDPGFPAAWRVAPYHDEIRRWAVAAAPTMGQVVVSIVRRTILVLPDRELDLGTLTDEDRIVTTETVLPDGRKVIEGMKLRYDDPRLSELGEETR